jgi:hypothetical protein
MRGLAYFRFPSQVNRQYRPRFLVQVKMHSFLLPRVVVKTMTVLSRFIGYRNWMHEVAHHEYQSSWQA